MEYVLTGKDEGENRGKLTIQDSRYHEDEVYVTIEYPGEQLASWYPVATYWQWDTV